MTELFSKLKKMSVEPKVYALLVKSVHGSILHLGIHFTWEEAYAYSCRRMNMLMPHKMGEQIDVDFWNSMSIRDVIKQAFDPSKVQPDPKTVAADPANPPVVFGGSLPAELLKAIMSLPPIGPEIGTDPFHNDVQQMVTVQDHINDVKDAKNELLNKLVETGDPVQVEKIGQILTTHEKKYVLKKIAEKQAKKPLDKPDVDTRG